MTIAQGSQVLHARQGIGTLQVEQGDGLALVEFKEGFSRVPMTELTPLPSWGQVLSEPEWHNPAEVLSKIQANAIRAINRQWGIFSLSRIQLLPHQLWVCRKVMEPWPSRWVVADDVGLGKTIEAGLILMSGLAHQRIKRFLILCPASLTIQWQLRLRKMFDIRTTVYDPILDKKGSHFWDDHEAVIASFHTLRDDLHDRHARLLASGPWDMVIVDEAHHLGAYEGGQRTKTFQLLRKLFDQKLVRSSVFFTGTPHKGNSFAFFSLMKLIRPDLFDPEKPAEPQFQHLQQAMIRNNKISATDLRGNRLFKGHTVSTLEFEYSDEEREFYERLTAFIEEGLLYAGGLADNEQRAVGLVLKAMQKLAASSVAAIRKALVKRLERLTTNATEIKKKEQLLDVLGSREDTEIDLDRQSRLDEEIAELSREITIIKNERPFLEELISLASKVTTESKITRIIEAIQRDLPDRSILFFTEYKATQALLISALNKVYGDHITGFINGDDRLEGVRNRAGNLKILQASRADQADAFNEGKLRFLVSTEAAGEGIDLQQQCHTLMHVDVPWNPMRMHQRVGRLHRYGQQHVVDVFTLLNPGTVENEIRILLQEKITRINKALGAVMDDPEDMLQLVLGMQGPGFFEELYSEGMRKSPDSSQTWFDAKTAKFGTADILSTVNSLLGNVAKFDFQSAAKDIPVVDLVDLVPFFRTALFLLGRELMTSGEDFEFVTPEPWKEFFGIKDRYEKVRFDRNAPKDRHVFGVGTQPVDKALDHAEKLTGLVAGLPSDRWPQHLAVFRVHDRVTEPAPSMNARIVGIQQDGSGQKIMPDSELVQLLNGALRSPKSLSLVSRKAPAEFMPCMNWLQQASEMVNQQASSIGHGFRVPGVEFIGAVFSIPNL